MKLLSYAFFVLATSLVLSLETSRAHAEVGGALGFVMEAIHAPSPTLALDEGFDISPGRQMPSLLSTIRIHEDYIVGLCRAKVGARPDQLIGLLAYPKFENAVIQNCKIEYRSESDVIIRAQTTPRCLARALSQLVKEKPHESCL